MLNRGIESKTIVFDFDETLAKVTFDKNALPNFDE
jgi:FMN phosphatase YigB (HAD superfamily)